MVKHLPTMQETWVRSLGWEDPLKKEMATHSSTLAWKIPWTQSTGSQRVGHDQAASLSLFFFHLTGEFSFLFFLFFCVCIFLNFIFKLYNIVLVLPYIEMNPP